MIVCLFVCLQEAVAGHYGYFYIQAKDAFGNNQNVGGDPFQVTTTPHHTTPPYC